MVQQKLLEEIAERNVVTLDEMKDVVEGIQNQATDNNYVYRKFVYSLLKKGYLRRIRRSLYHVTPPGKQISQADRTLIASRIRKDYYIGFHAALEFYGKAYSYSNKVHICVRSQNRFDQFTYDNAIYTPYITEDTATHVKEHIYRGETVRVCTKERLYLECVKHPGKAGGWEEVLKSLEGLGGIDFDMLIEYTIQLDSQALLRRMGLTLKLLQDSSVFYQHLDEKDIQGLSTRVTGKNQYLVQGAKGTLNKRWRLYVPDGFKEHLRGI